MKSIPTRVDIERERGRRSLRWFVEHAWDFVEKSQFNPNWHIDHICTHLEQVTRGNIRKLIINVPPGSGKSLLVSVFWPVWEWINDGTKAHLYTSFDSDLTLRDAGKVRDLIQSEWFSVRWPHVRIKDEGVKEFDIYDRNGHATGGWRFSTSVGGKTTGRHPDRKVIDDPTKPKEATKENLIKSHHWWQNTMRSRARDPATVSTVLIMQRLDEDDLAGYFLRQEKDWVHVRIPLEFDSKPYETTWGKDPRTVHGESFWPTRFTSSVCTEIKRETPDVGVYSSQYGQDPTPESGVVFKRDHFSNRYSILPDSGMWIQSWDFTFKGESDSDFVVGGVWLFSGGKFYLVDVVRGQMTFTQSLKSIKDLSRAHPHVVTKLIESKANGPAIISHLTEVEKVIGVVPVDPGQDSKLSRARAVVPLFEAGNVWLPTNASWVHDYVEELIKFPRGRRDDQVDMTSQALSYLVRNQGLDYASAMQNWRSMLT